MALKTLALALAALLTISPFATAQNERNPATPLIAFDPYFSVWSMADNLTDQNTKHWTGTEMPMRGFVRIDGTSYRWMGRSPGATPAMKQTGLQVTPTQTEYTFEAAGVRLQATFLSPDPEAATRLRVLGHLVEGHLVSAPRRSSSGLRRRQRIPV